MSDCLPVSPQSRIAILLDLIHFSCYCVLIVLFCVVVDNDFVFVFSFPPRSHTNITSCAMPFVCIMELLFFPFLFSRFSNSCFSVFSDFKLLFLFVSSVITVSIHLFVYSSISLIAVF